MKKFILAAAAVAIAAIGFGSFAIPQASANPANVYVINQNVAAALNAPNAVDLTTTTGRAVTGVIAGLSAFQTASAGQVSTLTTGAVTDPAGRVVILVKTDGSNSTITLNGRGLTCSPACDGTTATAPDSDGYLAFTVLTAGTHVVGDSIVATATQDGVTLDSSAIKIVGPATNFQIATPKATIQAGATTCGVLDATTAPEKAALVGTYTDVNSNALVGYSTAFTPAWASGSTGVAVGTNISMLLSDGTTTAAYDVVCGGAAGTKTISVQTGATAVQGVGAGGAAGQVTRTQVFTVTGVPATIALTAAPAAIACDGTSTSTVTAKVTDSAGNNVVDNTPVTFSVVALGTANPINAMTTGGTATSTITPLSGGTSGVVVTVTAGSAASSIRIDCIPSLATPTVPAGGPAAATATPKTGVIGPNTGTGGYLGQDGSAGFPAWALIALALGSLALVGGGVVARRAGK